MHPDNGARADAPAQYLATSDRALLKGQRRVLELLARRAPLRDVMSALCETIEEQLPRARCSVLLLDAKAGTLHHAAGPRLPKAYCEAIDGSKIGPARGSCGTAAYEHRSVTVEDIARDPLWVDFREIALAHSLAACASIPICDAADNVLGTFAIYLQEPGPFSPLALGLLRDMSGLATLAIESDRNAAALSVSEEKLRMAVDAAGVGLWSWDVQTDAVIWEDPLCAIFGYPRGKAPVGRDGYLALVHPEDRARAAATIAAGVAAGGWVDEYRILRSDGAIRWVIAKASVLRREGRELVLGAVIDMTHQRQQDEQLRQAQKLEAVGQLTAGIAHNFNNMLMGLLPNLSLAARQAPTELAPLLRGAEQSAERAAELVRQLMTYAGRNRPRARSVEAIGALVERTVSLCRGTFDQRIALEARYHPDARASVDPAQLEQATLNLLINARDALDGAAARDARVTVDVDVVRDGSPELAGHRGDHVRLRIADNGVGMDAATLARLYEPFFTTKAVGKGTGLGLATTRAIVREHDGFLSCESTPQKGATFSIYLPRVSEPVVEGERRAAPKASKVRGTETILVVDDEAPIRRVVSLMLRSAGYEPVVAASGKEALELLSREDVVARVALVLLDVSMPGMSTTELRSRLRALAPRARVVYFTGYAYEAADVDDAVLEKPITEELLLGTIRGVLDRPASR